MRTSSRLLIHIDLMLRLRTHIWIIEEKIKTSHWCNTLTRESSSRSNDDWWFGSEQKKTNRNKMKTDKWARGIFILLSMCWRAIRQLNRWFSMQHWFSIESPLSLCIPIDHWPLNTIWINFLLFFLSPTRGNDLESFVEIERTTTKSTDLSSYIQTASIDLEIRFETVKSRECLILIIDKSNRKKIRRKIKRWSQTRKLHVD